MPLAVVGSVLLTALIYVLLQVAFIGALSPENIAKGWSNVNFTDDFGPLAAVASILGLAGWRCCSTSTRSSPGPTPA